MNRGLAIAALIGVGLWVYSKQKPDQAAPAGSPESPGGTGPPGETAQAEPPLAPEGGEPPYIPPELEPAEPPYSPIAVDYISDIRVFNPPSREGERIIMVLAATLPAGYVFRAWFVSSGLKVPMVLTYPPGVGYLSPAYGRGSLGAEIWGIHCSGPSPHPDFPDDPSIGFPPSAMAGEFQIEVYSALADYSAIKELVYETSLPAILYSL